MYIKLTGKEFTGNIFKEMACQTCIAKILIGSIVYNETDSIVEFIIKRRMVDKYSINYFGFIKVKYKSNDYIKTKVQFRNVTSFNEINKDNKVVEFDMLLGLNVENNEAFITSVEEIEGETLFSLSIKYSVLDLTFEDI